MDSSMWRTAGTIALWVFGGYLGLLLLVYFMQPRLIYFPERTLAATPETAGLKYESVSFRTDDGVVLSGWFVPAEPCIGVVLFCHGNAGNMSHRLESIQLFHRLKLSTFIFDYRGYGSSEGKPSERGDLSGRPGCLGCSEKPERMRFRGHRCLRPVFGRRHCGPAGQGTRPFCVDRRVRLYVHYRPGSGSLSFLAGSAPLPVSIRNDPVSRGSPLSRVGRA